MSKTLLNDKAWMGTLPDLPMPETKVFLALCFLSDPGNAITFRTVDLIKASGLGRVTVNRCLAGLSDRQMIAISERKCGSGGTTTLKINKWYAKAI